MIGVMTDSHGDLDAFDAAYELLREKGAKRFFFAGGRYTDLDDWVSRRREKQRGGRQYSDTDFLADVSSWLSTQTQPTQRAVFGVPDEADDGGASLKLAFLRTPERDSIHHRDETTPRKMVDMVGDALCCLVHDKNDLDRDDLLNGVLFIHGKEAEPKVVQIGPRYFLTPGRLTGAAEQTCGLIEKAEGGLTFSAFRLDGVAVLEPRSIVLDRRTKLSAK